MNRFQTVYGRITICLAVFLFSIGLPSSNLVRCLRDPQGLGEVHNLNLIPAEQMIQKELVNQMPARINYQGPSITLQPVRSGFLTSDDQRTSSGNQLVQPGLISSKREMPLVNLAEKQPVLESKMATIAPKPEAIGQRMSPPASIGSIVSNQLKKQDNLAVAKNPESPQKLQDEPVAHDLGDGGHISTANSGTPFLPRFIKGFGFGFWG